MKAGGFVDPCMEALPLATRNFILATYIASLSTGKTLLGIHIRSRTLRHYISDACALFRLRGIAYTNDIITDYVKLMLSAAKRYESIPNRRHMISDEMRRHLYKRARETGPDSIEAAIFDWITFGCYTGFRRSEAFQTTQTKYERVLDHPDQPARALILEDLLFFDHRKRLLKGKDITKDRVWYVRVVYRFQKNGDNGEETDFARDTANPRFCPVLAAWRIYDRALRLEVPAGEPIAVYSNKGKRRFITDSLIQKHLRVAAKKVHKITDKKVLQRWSTHSIRVTAANLLHRANMADSFIQIRLRWKSTSFLMYLRNTFYSAARHTNALNVSESNLPPSGSRACRPREAHEAVTHS